MHSLKHRQRPSPCPKVIKQTTAPVLYFNGSTVSVNDTKQYAAPLFVVGPGLSLSAEYIYPLSSAMLCCTL